MLQVIAYLNGWVSYPGHPRRKAHCHNCRPEGTYLRTTLCGRVIPEPFQMQIDQLGTNRCKVCQRHFDALCERTT